jgi:carbohydrate-binding DOMON domain-containing protein
MEFIFLSGDILDANKRKEIALSNMNQSNSSGQSYNTATHIATITVNVTEMKGTKNTTATLSMSSSTSDYTLNPYKRLYRCKPNLNAMTHVIFRG